MSDDHSPRQKMEHAGTGAIAISVFERQVEHVRSGVSPMVSDADIDPYDSPPLPAADASAPTAITALDETAVIRLNGGLGTSMGMDRAKSLLPVRQGLSFLDIIVRQIVDGRQRYGARLPLTFLHSFRTSADCLQALAHHPELSSSELDAIGIPLELMQNQVPKLLADSFTPVSWPADPELEWCPPGHGEIYTVLYEDGLLDRLAAAGFKRVFIANSDNLGARATPEMAAWFAGTGAPFAIEAVRRTPSDRKGGHFARRKRDGRLILRETAQTPPDEQGQVERHRFASTNNLWFDIDAARALLAERDGDMQLPVIVNTKTVDPADPSSPAVVQLETAMGAAIEAFDGATTVEVGRDRFVPVKTTNDLLVVRSDCYRLTDDSALEQVSATIPFVDLHSSYKYIDGFDARFPAGAPSLVDATSLVVRGDWTFGAGVRIVGDVELGPEGGTVPDGAVLGG